MRKKIKKLSQEEALERLKYTCSKGEKCLYDVRKKLTEWNLTESYDTISKELLKENYIEESRYATSFANDKIKYSKWGKLKVQYQLRLRGIKDSYIFNALDEIYDEDYLPIIKKEVMKKARSLKETDNFKRQQKIFAFAAQRGYEIEIVRKLINFE